MRLGVVLRSVAVMLAAPLLALPAGGAEDESVARVPTTHRSTPLPAPTARRLDEASSQRPVPPAAADHPKAVPLNVTVDCADDGCVVQNGLDVLVVGP